MARELDRERPSVDGFLVARSNRIVCALPGSDVADAVVPVRPEREEAGVFVEDHSPCIEVGDVLSRES